MPALSAFSAYGGAFPTTASLAGALAAQSCKAPHTGKPYSEDLLMGIAGGAAFGYFSFAYKGHDPQANILTRNTFGNYGWDAAVERLGISQDVMNSTSPAKAEQKLVETLESGGVPIVWVDVFSLGYESSDLGEGMWLTMPVVVTKYENHTVTLSDRSGAPIEVPQEVFRAARAKIKKLKFRLVTVDAPEDPDLAAALSSGVQDSIELYNGNPPQGSGKNWGGGGIDLWRERLIKRGAKESWEKLFPPGRPFFCGLTSAYRYALQFWEDDTRSADRLMYARFLREASTITGESGFEAVAQEFEKSARSWQQLATALLPDRIEILAKARGALEERDTLFRASGSKKLDQLRIIDERLDGLKDEAEGSLADPDACSALREEIASHLEGIREQETAAVKLLTEALASAGSG